MSQTESQAPEHGRERVSEADPRLLRSLRENAVAFVVAIFGQKGPPFFFQSAGFRQDSGPHATIHRAYNRVALSFARTPGYRLRFWIKVIVYPLVWLARMIRIMTLHGAETARRSGKSRFRQLREVMSLSYTHSIPPEAYYLFRLFLPEERQHARQFVHRFETKDEYGLFRLLNRNLGDESASFLLGNKRAFEQRCRDRDLPTPEVFLEVVDGKVIPRAWDRPGLPQVDLIVKPRKGKGGRVMTRWELQEDGSYLADTGKRLDAEGVLRHLKQKSRWAPLIVVPRVLNHPDVLCFAGPEGKILTTCRLVTARNESDEPEVVSSTFKIAVRQTVADNVHFGGLASPVDIHTGTLGPGIETEALGTPVDIHPLSRARITGARLPMWDEVLALVKRAQNAFPEALFIGWDVGLTPEGPILIEGNSGTCVHLQQTPQGEPLGAGRFGEIMAYHLNRIDRTCFGPLT